MENETLSILSALAPFFCAPLLFSSVVFQIIQINNLWWITRLSLFLSFFFRIRNVCYWLMPTNVVIIISWLSIAACCWHIKKKIKSSLVHQKLLSILITTWSHYTPHYCLYVYRDQNGPVGRSKLTMSDLQQCFNLTNAPLTAHRLIGWFAKQKK